MAKSAVKPAGRPNGKNKNLQDEGEIKSLITGLIDNAPIVRGLLLITFRRGKAPENIHEEVPPFPPEKARTTILRHLRSGLTPVQA